MYAAVRVPFRCFAFATGKVMGESAPTMQFAQVSAAGGKLIVLELGGTLHIIEASPKACREVSSACVLGGACPPAAGPAPASAPR